MALTKVDIIAYNRHVNHFLEKKMKDFVFKTQPYDHQMKALKDSWAATYYALFMEMGTGKTKVAIDTIGILYEQGKIDTVLVIAPKGVYDNWVRGEIPTHLPDRIPRKIYRWIPAQTNKNKAELEEITDQPFDGLKIFVMNVEAFSTNRGAQAAMDFLNFNPHNMVIVDESTTIKNRAAKRTKNIVKLKTLSKYRRILTGSPVTKSPMDLFSQCSFLDQKALGLRSYFAFQGRYAVMHVQRMGHRSFNKITGYRRLDELTQKLDKFSNRILKEDCLDLPEKVYLRREVSLTEEQKRLYLQMKKLALAKLDNGDLSTTASVLTQIMRMQQICCGFIQPDEGDIQPIHNNRMSHLLEAVEETQGKCIIWATYTYDIKNIAANLSKLYGEETVATYYGATPQDERQEIVNRIQDPEDPLRFFVGQARTGGYGITLTQANTVIYYSNSYDLEIRLQSEDRAHRIGQKNNVTYVDLVCPDTIDEKILKALREKSDIAGKVLGEEAREWLS